MKILIADDSALMRDRIRNVVSTICNVKIVGEVDNGADALRLFFEKEPDLVILDIRMPEINGIEVLKRIRKMKSETCVCILTNYPYKQYREKCIEEGVDFFLSKSENFEELGIIIHELSLMKI
jgi:DNA-binding NarL/FixJ family response regulator